MIEHWHDSTTRTYILSCVLGVSCLLIGGLLGFREATNEIYQEYLTTDRSCRDKMEATMRAMEPFANWSIGLEKMSYGEKDEFLFDLEGWLKAWRQWQAVKRACWREK